MGKHIYWNSNTRCTGTRITRFHDSSDMIEFEKHVIIDPYAIHYLPVLLDAVSSVPFRGLHKHARLSHRLIYSSPLSYYTPTIKFQRLSKLLCETGAFLRVLGSNPGNILSDSRSESSNRSTILSWHPRLLVIAGPPEPVNDNVSPEVPFYL